MCSSEENQNTLTMCSFSEGKKKVVECLTLSEEYTDRDAKFRIAEQNLVRLKKRFGKTYGNTHVITIGANDIVLSSSNQCASNESKSHSSSFRLAFVDLGERMQKEGIQKLMDHMYS